MLERWNMRNIVVWAVIVWLVSVTAGTAQETRRYFQDWLAACRTDGFCSAIGYDNTASTAGVDADYLLRVGRQAEGLYWEISLTTVLAFPGVNEGFDVTVDNTPFQFSPPFDVGAYGSINEFYFLNDGAQDLFDALGPGDQVRFTFTDEGGQSRTASFSLRGLTAALLWIDEQQGRIGSERVTGAAPLELTPVSSDHPASVPAELLRLHARNEHCEPFEVLPHADEVLQAELDGAHVYFLPCTAGAYNFGYTAWSQRNGFFSPILFAEYSDYVGWTGTEFIVNPDLDPVSGILTAFSKGRGIGDCGSFGRWQWTGYEFRMLEYAYKDECDAAGGLETFPVIFSAKGQTN